MDWRYLYDIGVIRLDAPFHRACVVHNIFVSFHLEKCCDMIIPFSARRDHVEFLSLVPAFLKQYTVNAVTCEQLPS